jgi:hypothetical protein
MAIYLGNTLLTGGGSGSSGSTTGAIVGTVAPLEVGGSDSHTDEYGGTWIKTGVVGSATSYPNAAASFQLNGTHLATSYNQNYTTQVELPHFYATVNGGQDLSLYCYTKTQIVAAVADRTLTTALSQPNFRSSGHSDSGMRSNGRLISAAYNDTIEITVYNDKAQSFSITNSVVRAFKDVGGTNFFFGVRALPTVTTNPFATTEPVTSVNISASNFDFDSSSPANSIVGLAAHPTDGSFYALVSASTNTNARVGDDDAWIVQFDMTSSGATSNFSIVSGAKIAEFSTDYRAAVTAIGIYGGSLVVHATVNQWTANSPSNSNTIILQYNLSTGTPLAPISPDITPTISDAGFDWYIDKGMWTSDDYLMVLNDYSSNRGMLSYNKIVGGGDSLYLQNDGSISTALTSRPIYIKVN